MFDYYKGRRVLVTGHTGFKGSWLTHWLKLLGAEVCGIALAPDTNPSLFDLIHGADNIASHHSCSTSLARQPQCARSKMWRFNRR